MFADTLSQSAPHISNSFNSYTIFNGNMWIALLHHTSHNVPKGKGRDRNDPTHNMCCRAHRETAMTYYNRYWFSKVCWLCVSLSVKKHFDPPPPPFLVISRTTQIALKQRAHITHSSFTSSCSCDPSIFVSANVPSLFGTISHLTDCQIRFGQKLKQVGRGLSIVFFEGRTWPTESPHHTRH